MNRISIRGVGTAAAALAATALAVGSNTPAADAQEAATPVSAASSLALHLMATNSNTGVGYPAAFAGNSRTDSAAADLFSIRQVRWGALAASTAQARALAAARVLAAQKAQRARSATRVNRSHARPVAPGSTRALGEKLAAAKGWSGVQWQCLDNVWTHESGWSSTAANPSGAYGIPQATPGSKMASAGADWRTNPVTQIEWGLSYIANAYGNPCAAWAFWQTHEWY